MISHFACYENTQIIMEELHMPLALLQIVEGSKNYKDLILFSANKHFITCFGNSPRMSRIGDLQLSHPDEFIEIYKDFLYTTSQPLIKHIDEYAIIDKTDQKKKTIYYKFSFVKIHNQFIGIHGTDVTAKVQEKELLNRILNTRNELLGYLSHEIRTPLNGIAAATELINRSNLLPKELQKYTSILDSCSVTLLTIINDLLDLSRMEAKKMELIYKPFNLTTCVNNAVSAVTTVSGSADPRGIVGSDKNVQITIDPNLPSEYIGDSVRIKQIISNFVSNGIKFSNGKPVFVNVEYLGTEDINVESYNDLFKTYENFISSTINTIKLVTIKFSVRDNGIGIPMNKVGMLFTPFLQLDAGLKKTYSGAGIGLSICKNLINLMNGHFNVVSKENDETTFSFTIRLPEYSARTNQLSSINYDALIGKSILIIDDNETNLRFIESTLLRCKMLAMKANSPRSAIDDYLIHKIPFSMIIVDICMADIDGCELAKMIRETYGYECPIFGMSSINVDLLPTNDIAIFKKIMMKPISSMELISTLSLKGQPPSPSPCVSRRSSASSIIEKILLVEDNKVNIDVTISQLETLGYKDIAIAVDGRNAIRLVKENKYTIILMDISLGADLDGIELTEKILSVYKNIHKPRIIGLTANTMTETLQMAKNAGMEKILVKPVSIDTLMNELK
jgi:signal transduction histidine kinase/DNA-binding response OmpR family regulator